MRRLKFSITLGAMVVIAIGFNNCGQVAFNSQNDPSNVGLGLPFDDTQFGGDIFDPNCVFSEKMISDSFEGRTEVAGTTGNPFGWRKIVNDMGKIGSTADRVGAEIFLTSPLGSAANGNSAVYFYGRPGSSVHNVYLISTALPLANHRELGISFAYLPIALESGEYLRLEVCNGTAAACGVGSSFNAKALKNGPWVKVFEASSDAKSRAFNGLNHARTDWLFKTLRIEMNKFPHSAQSFIFRFNARMDEGFKAFRSGVPVAASGLVDGVALDAVSAGAITCH